MNFLHLCHWVVSALILSLSCGKDWHNIQVRLGSVVPDYVMVQEGASVIARCGSVTQVWWTYTNHVHRRPKLPVPSRHRRGYKTIILKNLLKEHSGFYYCHGLNENRSFQIHLRVMVSDKVLTGKVLPNWVEVSLGSSVSLTCGSTKPVEWLSVNYYHQNKTTTPNILTLHDLQKNHSGRYLCRGYDRYWGETFHSSATIIVEAYVEYL